MNAYAWIMLLVLGGLAGMLGQMGRVIVGMKKVADEAAAAGKPCRDLIEPARLLLSLVIGFTAGAVAALLVKGATEAITPQQVVGFAGAGYAGADFIEGAMSSALPGGRATATTTTTTTVTAPVVAAAVATDDGAVG